MRRPLRAPVATGLLAVTFVLALASDGRSQTDTSEILVAGEHAWVAGETPDLARLIALANARRLALQAARASLLDRDDVRAVGLAPAAFDAYAAVIVEIEEPAAPAALSTPTRVEVRAAWDAGRAARRLAAFRADQETAYELVEVWQRTQRLHRLLAEQTRRRADAPGADAAQAIALEQRETLTALAVNDLAARAYAALVRTEPQTVGGRATAAGGLDRARRLAGEALVLSPESPVARYLAGDLLIEMEAPDAAEAEYRRALAAEPEPSSAGRTRLALALRYQGKLPEALVEINEAIRIDPAYARAHADLGMILGAQRQVPAAIAAYGEAIRLDPDFVDARNGLAIMLANSRRLPDAVEQFREIVRIDPDSTIGYYNLAYALADLSRDTESAAALREVVRINPNHYNARYNLGELFRLEGKFDESANQFREYLRLAPDTPQNQRNITRARGFVRQFEDPDAPAVADRMMRRSGQ